MVERGYKKGLVLGIIVLFIGVGVQPAFAVNLSKNTVESESNSGRALPDLVIIDVYKEECNEKPYWYMQALVKNIGEGTVTNERWRTFRCVVKRPYLGIIVYDFIEVHLGPSIPPGETTKTFRFWPGGPEVVFPGIYKVYWEIDEENFIPESNENNNVIWAYYQMGGLFSTYPPKRVSEFVTCSEINLEGYYRGTFE